MQLGVNGQDSDLWDASFHVDYPVNNFYPLIEFNMVHVVDAGSRIGLEGEGFDLVNFGSSGSDGSTVVTSAVGLRYRACDWVDFGVAYEFALSDREDIFDWRVTTDLVFKLPYTAF